ncbi:hypothetical protein P3T76_013625 [Phytophthora citrophthora]|uniref:Uncharacterized protein n=1 Tax=Phytophthora citrophthora TaxID=4793 RepID=A0AAD9G2Q4_9STRA|nr:hypothetical protein P3T76_013625 [Phytophthora citrophthora]
MYVTYKWSETRFDMIASLCFALSNYCVSYMPLRSEDSTHYRSVLARYQSMADEAKEKRARSQKAYRTRRDERLATPAVQSLSTRRTRSAFQRPALYRRPAQEDEETQLSQAF